VVHPKACGILSCPSGGACDASRHLKILFRHIVGNFIVSFSYWCGGCHRWWSGLASVGFFFPSSLLSLKNYSLTLLVFGISTSVLILLMSNFWSWPFCISFIYFQFYPSILFYQILYSPMWFSFFRFLIFFLIFS